jgi:hypothetical protein
VVPGLHYEFDEMVVNYINIIYGYLIIFFNANMRIFDKRTLNYVATEAEGFDYIIEEIVNSILIF